MSPTSVLAQTGPRPTMQTIWVSRYRQQMEQKGSMLQALSESCCANLESRTVILPL